MFTPRRDIGLCLHDIDRSESSDLHSHFVLIQRLLRQFERSSFYVQVLAGENKIPIGLLRLNEKVRQLDFEFDSDFGFRISDLSAIASEGP